MNIYTKVRLKLMCLYASRYNMLEHIPNNILNRLRYRYHLGLPISFYILVDDLGHSIGPLKEVLFTKIFEDSDDYKILSCYSKLFNNHLVVECNNYIYDLNLLIKMDKDLYFKIFNVKVKSITSKEAIKDYIKTTDLGNSTYEDAIMVPFSIMETIEDYLNTTNTYYHELLERQYNSYKKDINYNDYSMIIETKKKTYN